MALIKRFDRGNVLVWKYNVGLVGLYLLQRLGWYSRGQIRSHHEKHFAQGTRAFPHCILCVEGHNCGKSKNEGVDIFHVEIICCDSIGDGVFCQSLRLFGSIPSD